MKTIVTDTCIAIPEKPRCDFVPRKLRLKCLRNGPEHDIAPDATVSDRGAKTVEVTETADNASQDKVTPRIFGRVKHLTFAGVSVNRNKSIQKVL